MLVQRYLNIARSVEQGIAAGRFTAGDVLPPVRELARQLGVSNATVAAAYRLLRDRGVVLADGRRGTRVRPAAPIAHPPPAPAPPGTRDLATGNPDPALLPDLQAALRRLRVDPPLYGHTLAERSLLATAARRFATSRVPHGAIAVVSGALDGIERVLREHLRPGDRVIVEDPCFTGITDLLAVLGLAPVPVPVDDEGLLPAPLRRALRRNVGAVIVTPRAQNPTGAAFSARRARELRPIVASRDVLLVEDDHAAEIAGAAYRTLVTPQTQRWAVVRSVSKALGPDLRVAVLAADPDTLARVEGRQTLGIRWVSHILQRTVATLQRDRRVTRLLEKAARTYAERRRMLIRALAAHGLQAHGASGLNVWIPVPEESAVVAALLQRGWAVTPGARYRIESPPAIRVTVAALTRHEATRFANDLATALRPRWVAPRPA